MRKQLLVMVYSRCSLIHWMKLPNVSDGLQNLGPYLVLVEGLDLAMPAVTSEFQASKFIGL
jgi:hypothetical protein